MKRSINASANNPPHADILHAARVIRAGGIVVHATEYCFGLACDPRNVTAVQRLLRIKRRPAKKGVILIAADVEQLRYYTTHIPNAVSETWPGPHTWLLAPTARAPRWVTGRHPRIALRVTAHAQAAALCAAVGHPLISTSANRAGEKPARQYRDAVHRLGPYVDYVLLGRVGTLPNPTPIRDGVTGTVVRPG